MPTPNVFEVQTFPGIVQPSGYEHRVVNVIFDDKTKFLSGRRGDLKPGQDVEIRAYMLDKTHVKALDVTIHNE